MRLKRLLVATAATGLMAGCGTTVPLADRSGQALQSAQGGTSGADGSGSQLQSGSAATQQVSPDGTTSGAPGRTTSGASFSGGHPSVSAGPSAGPAHLAPRSGPGSYNSIPLTGRGWDAKNVYIGVTVETDASTIGGTIGYDSIDYGDQKKLISSAIAAVNARGGVYGRKLTPIYYDVNSAGNTDSEAAEACALWTQDNKVISASLVGLISNQTMYTCMHKAHTPITTGLPDPYTAKDLDAYAPEMLNSAATVDRMVDPWITTLERLGYFGKWDSSKGAPGTAPVKVAILHKEVPYFDRAWELVRKRLEQRGHHVVDVLSYTSADSGSFGNFALRMRADGVTHLLFDSAATLFYPSAAESQGFRARYAVTTYNSVLAFLVNGPVPKAQLAGMVGLGWSPLADMREAQLGRQTPSQLRCLADEHRYGADTSKQNYRYIAYSACDGFNAIQLAASYGHGLTESAYLGDLRQALGAMTFANGFGGTPRTIDPSTLARARGFVFDAGCACTKYAGPVVSF